jgi:hypothetical protein
MSGLVYFYRLHINYLSVIGIIYYYNILFYLLASSTYIVICDIIKDLLNIPFYYTVYEIYHKYFITLFIVLIFIIYD